MLGQHDEAGTLAQRGRELGAEQDVLTQTLWRRVDALVLASRGEYQEAERLAREAVAIIERTDGLRWQGDALCDLAEVLQRAGRSQDAATSLQQALDRYERKRNLAMAAQVRQRMGAGKGSAPLA
jgi:tetratricopeptide (TPR) repeat protein